MPPKAVKKKKKTKEELEAERRAAEEAARLAEEGQWALRSFQHLCTAASVQEDAA